MVDASGNVKSKQYQGELVALIFQE